jgi:AAA family ATP:ADP antiporter
MGDTSKQYNLFYRFLRLFTDIRSGEATKALLLALNVFLILLGYYIIKPVRNALILTATTAEFQTYMGAAQAFFIIFLIKGFSRLSSRVARHVLITWVTLFFISNLLIFYLMNVAAVPMKTIGIIFYIWIGIYNYMVVAQFWGFANDLYTHDIGKRIFPLIAFGATLGAPIGSQINKWLVKPLGVYKLMLLPAVLLGICILLSIYIHKRDIRTANERRISVDEGSQAREREEQQPLKKGGAFQLVLKSRYLLLIALLIGLYNFINSNGEYMISNVVRGMAQRAVNLGATGGMNMEQYISMYFAGYQQLTSILAILIQLFLVSRIFKWVGIGGALLFLPIISLGGYGYMTFGVSLIFLRWVKSLENGTDYSLMNTTKAALFLKTSREEKYKAKAAIDTFFVRGGDTISALAVFLGTTYLHAKVEGFAQVNVIAILIWIAICLLIMREYKKIKPPAIPVPSS